MKKGESKVGGPSTSLYLDGHLGDFQIFFITSNDVTNGLPRGRSDKEFCLPMQENTRDAVLIPGLERSPGLGNGNPLQYSCLENFMDRGDYSLHGVTASQTRLSMHERCDKYSLYIYTHMRAHTHTHIFLCSCERISPGEYVVGDFYFQLYQLLSKMVASIFTPAIKKFLFSHIHLIFDIRLFKKHFYNLMGLWGCDLGKGSFGRVAGTEKTECLGWERVGDSEIRLVGVNYAFSSFSCRRNEEVLELVEHLCYNWGVLSCLE